MNVTLYSKWFDSTCNDRTLIANHAIVNERALGHPKCSSTALVASVDSFQPNYTAELIISGTHIVTNMSLQIRTHVHSTALES
jgi:hypothetical protein